MQNFTFSNELTQLLDHAPEGFYITKPSAFFPFTEFVVWNQYMLIITGYTQEEANALGWNLTLTKTDSSKTFMPEDLSYEAEILTKNGAIKTVGVTISTLTIDAILYTITVMRDITSFKHYEAILLEQAQIDPLTNIANRRSIINHIQHAIAHASRTSMKFCLLMLDLDYFKNVNDTYGHAVGDIVLAQSVIVMRNVLRPYDEIGRLSGEEFIVILPESTVSAAQTVGGRICNAMRKHIFSAEDRTFVVTVSIGGTIFLPNDTGDAIIKRADDNLYKAKHSGRDRIIMD